MKPELKKSLEKLCDDREKLFHIMFQRLYGEDDTLRHNAVKEYLVKVRIIDNQIKILRSMR